ncbi:MAG: SPOR domain-containing protein [Magnetococcales bacterium]|nr:SPOR domain-containing protein [Magnetococcales bacterium]
MSPALAAMKGRLGGGGALLAVGRFVPLTLVTLFFLLNLHLLWLTLKKPTDTLWTGPLMMGKALPLDIKSAEKGEKAAKTEGKEHQPAKEKEKEAPHKKEKVVEKPPPAHATTKPTVQERHEAKPAVVEHKEAGSAADGNGYYVQAGSFAIRKGADTLATRLRAKGLNPNILQQTEMVLVNNVQAGPYRLFDDAKEAEIKLRSAGVLAKTDNTWEGYTISIGKEIQLGSAIDSMGNAEKLGVKPLRIIKVEDAQKFFKVILGPYKTEREAKDASANLAASGLAVPLIKRWDASEEAAQKESEG